MINIDSNYPESNLNTSFQPQSNDSEDKKLPKQNLSIINTEKEIRIYTEEEIASKIAPYRKGYKFELLAKELNGITEYI